MQIEELSYPEFSRRYCEKMESTPEELKATLVAQNETYKPTAWLLLECVDFCSSRFGNLVVIPYGPNNTLKAIPTHPVSPRGLASDMSVVVATLSPEALLA